jgi:hypothetical protein
MGLGACAVGLRGFGDGASAGLCGERDFAVAFQIPTS